MKVRKNIIKERVKASDFNKINLKFACEDCTYFIKAQKLCSLGYKTTPHLYENQIKLYQQSGHLTFCRFLEID